MTKLLLSSPYLRLKTQWTHRLWYQILCFKEKKKKNNGDVLYFA